MPDSKEQQPRTPYRVTKEDKAWIERRLADRKWTRAELARRAGMTRQNLYLLLNGTASWTYEWAAIVAALGGTPPSGVAPLIDDRLRELIRRWPELSEADKALVEQIARRFGTKKA